MSEPVNAKLLAACKLALNAFENNWAIDWNELAVAIAEAEAPKLPPDAVDVWVNGIVAVRDNQPYVQLLTSNGIMTQWNVTEARKVANDIILMCSRVEADAMLVKFFGKMDFPDGAVVALMHEFREYRHSLDMLHVESKDDPEVGQ